MAEKMIPVEVYLLQWLCDDCSLDMQFTGRVMQTNKAPMFEHHCRQCKSMKFLDGQYPRNHLHPVGKEYPEWMLELLKDPKDRKPAPEPEKKPGLIVTKH